MDYSLLLAVEQKTRVVTDEEVQSNGSSEGSRRINNSLAETQSSSGYRTVEKRSKLTSDSREAELSSIAFEESNDSQWRYILESDCDRYKYHISLIDYLQEWDTNKKLERFAKCKLQNADEKGLSAIEPSDYQKRFFYFVRDVFLPSRGKVT